MNIQEKYEHRIRTVMPESHEYKYLFSDLSENKAYYQKCINQTVNAVLDHLEHRHTPFTGRSVSSLKEAIDKIYLDDTSMGDRLSEVLHELKTLYLDDAVSFHQPKYVAHLNCPILIPALAAEVIISSLNTSMDTWDQSAGGTLIDVFTQAFFTHNTQRKPKLKRIKSPGCLYRFVHQIRGIMHVVLFWIQIVCMITDEPDISLVTH